MLTLIMTPRYGNDPVVSLHALTLMFRLIDCMTSRNAGVVLLGLLIGLLPGASNARAGPAEKRGPGLLVHPSQPLGRSVRGASIKVEVNLVLVPVTVTDPRGRLVSGLQKENFKVFENKKRQSIVSFSGEDVPASIGLVFDTSGSMRDKIVKARSATKSFFETLNPDDEAFLLTFAGRPTLPRGFSSNFSQMQNSLFAETPKGRTALIDAVFLALDRMGSAGNPRRALLVVSDGIDNHSRYLMRDLMEVAVEADVQIYSIGIHDWLRNLDEPAERIEIRRGHHLLEDLSELTGGMHLVVKDFNNLKDVMHKIAIALHNQYVIGYHPPGAPLDGKWRKINVRLDPPRGLPPLNVYARRGYYGGGRE